jgi:hypothetical protein
MAGKRNEALTTNLEYPMVDLLTNAVMPLVYLNILTASYLMLLTAPWLFMQTWTKELETKRAS